MNITNYRENLLIQIEKVFQSKNVPPKDQLNFWLELSKNCDAKVELFDIDYRYEVIPWNEV